MLPYSSRRCNQSNRKQVGLLTQPNHVKFLIAVGCPSDKYHVHSDAFLVHSEADVLFREEIKQLRRTTKELPASTCENHGTDLAKAIGDETGKKEVKRHNRGAVKECMQLLILLFSD